MKAWIGVDLDGTLAEYDGWQGPQHIGRPIQPMVDRVADWLKEGKAVKIMTARVSHDGTRERIEDANSALDAIQAWCVAVFGFPLEVTNIKDYGMVELWDDRAIQVIPNTGQRVDGQS